MHMYVGSQWFTLPRHVVQWLLQDPLPYHYESYARHVVVADENYFATLISNSPYCADIIRRKTLFLIFDKWENEKSGTGSRVRDQKCLSPDPDHCGRSPSILTLKFKNLLQISRATFARKFDPTDFESSKLLDEIDLWRKGENEGERVGDEGRQIMIRFRGRRGDGDADVSGSGSGSGSESNVGGQYTTVTVDIEGTPTATTTTTPHTTTRDNSPDKRQVNTHDSTQDNHDQQYNQSQTHSQSQGQGQNVDISYCWVMSKLGQPLTLEPCNAASDSQWFVLGTYRNLSRSNA